MAKIFLKERPSIKEIKKSITILHQISWIDIAKIKRISNMQFI